MPKRICYLCGEEFTILDIKVVEPDKRERHFAFCKRRMDLHGKQSTGSTQ